MTAADQLAALAVSAARRTERFDDAYDMALTALRRAPEPLAADPATEDARYLAAFRAGMEAVLEAQALQRAMAAAGRGHSVLRVIQGGT